MLSQIIQRQVSIGSKVTFSLKDGSTITGHLMEIGRDHVTVEDNGKTTTITIETIAHWQVEVAETPQLNELPSKSQFRPNLGTESLQSVSQLNEVQSIPLPSQSIEPHLLERLLEIKTGFNAQLSLAKIDLRPPDPLFPIDELKDRKVYRVVQPFWQEIRSIYDYSKRIGELEAKFGRSQRIAAKLKALDYSFPNILTIKRHLAYFYFLSANIENAIKYYQEAARTFAQVDDWYNLAVLTLAVEQKDIAYHSLGQFLQKSSLAREQDAWLVYISLLLQNFNYSDLVSLIKSRRYWSEDDERILFETGIYLLLVSNREIIAADLVQKSLNGGFLKSLAIDAFNKFETPLNQVSTQHPKEIALLDIDEKKSPKSKPAKPSPPEKKIQIQSVSSQNDLEQRVEALYAEIRKGGNIERTVKELATFLMEKLGRRQEAVKVLEDNRTRIVDPKSLDNMLIHLYQQTGQHDKAINLLQPQLSQNLTDQAEKARVLGKISTSYLALKDYSKAEIYLSQLLEIQPDSKVTRRNLALCLYQQKSFDRAKEILDPLLHGSPDTYALTILDAINRAKATGESEPDVIDDIIVEIMLSDFSDFSGEKISVFAKFFLDRCQFKGVPPNRVQTHNFRRSDVEELEVLATQLGTRRPRDRAEYYLSAAKIVSILEEGESSDRFYRYLGRSFASMGDAAVLEGKLLDGARELYTEALAVYDGDRSRSRDEQDAVNALVRFLFSTLGPTHIPLQPNGPSIDEAIGRVLVRHPYPNKVFEAIAYLVFRSRYASTRILNRLYDNKSSQRLAIKYLQSMGLTTNKSTAKFTDFISVWNKLRNEYLEKARTVSDEFRFLRRVELTTVWLEDSIGRTNSLKVFLFFELDKQRVDELQKILEMALELCKEVTFEEQERLCFQIDKRCQELLVEIADNPTKLSIEEFIPVVEKIQKKTKEKLDELYQQSVPELSIRLAVESYMPDPDNRIEIQIVVANQIGRSPAEAPELTVFQEEKGYFNVIESTVKLDGSLRGGNQEIVKVPIQVSQPVLRSEAFSLSVYAKYRTRSEESIETPIQNLSVRLYPEDEFEEIENPYASYAEGGIVAKPEMFYGREELIENVAQAIIDSRDQSKCIVIFGQKRAGKSSILYHLNTKFQVNKDILVLDIGNIGSILDDYSKTPLLYQILWGIIAKLGFAVEDRVTQGFSSLNISFPNINEFYQHPSPLAYFKEIFERFRRACLTQEDWRHTRIVLMIDEFAYIYGQIVSGKLSDQFMKNWKALLQENYFSAVLAGQDVMPKFKERFANEFGTAQDERVTYLKPEYARRLIDEPIRYHGESRYREQAIERILHLTAGSPFYIQIICNRLVDYMNSRGARLVTEADVDQIKNELIRGVNALGIDKFDNLISSGDTSPDAISNDDALEVLRVIALNSRNGPCSRSNITSSTKTPVDVILEDLVKRDVVARDAGQFYWIRVGLFKEWLIANT